MGVRTDAGQASMVGRGSVLAICGMALRRARTGQGSLLLVTGEPGIGKTTLLLAAAAEAREQGCAVAWAACPEEDAAPAFWPLVQLPVGDRPPGHENGSGRAQWRCPRNYEPEQIRAVRSGRYCNSPRRGRATLAARADDLHWADASSVRLLGFLVKQMRTDPVLVLGSYRDTEIEAGHPLLEMLAEPGTSGETLMLSGLATDEVATLLSTAGEETPAIVAQHIRDHTAGNPFFVVAGCPAAERGR